MNPILTVLQIVAPVFALAAIGYVWVKLGFEYRIQFVTRMAMTLSVPCLVFNALQQAEIAQEALSAVFLATVASYALMTAVVFLIVKMGRMELRTYLAPLVFGNTGNLGLPLALFAFGETGLGYAVVIFAIMAIYSFSAGVWFVSGGGSASRLIREPLVAASILGTLFLWQGWKTPEVVTNTLQLIGQMAIPLMLITLGVAIARLAPRQIWRPFLLSVAKFAISVGIAWPIGRYFGLGDIAFAVLVLQLATPVAVTSFMIAEKYQADSDTVAGMVVVSTMLSVVGLPLILALLI